MDITTWLDHTHPFLGFDLSSGSLLLRSGTGFRTIRSWTTLPSPLTRSLLTPAGQKGAQQTLADWIGTIGPLGIAFSCILPSPQTHKISLGLHKEDQSVVPRDRLDRAMRAEIVGKSETKTRRNGRSSKRLGVTRYRTMV